MCGISGKYSINKKTDHIENSIISSLKKLFNRGPDDFGIKKISLLNGILVLGHRRLSIIDLTEGGKQPMSSKRGQFTIIFNGEIYNFLELKKSLEGTDVEEIKKKTQNLIQVSMKLGEAVYKSQQKKDDNNKGPGGGAKDTKPSEKDNVVDADFEDVKEDKEKSA